MDLSLHIGDRHPTHTRSDFRRAYSAAVTPRPLFVPRLMALLISRDVVETNFARPESCAYKFEKPNETGAPSLTAQLPAHDGRNSGHTVHGPSAASSHVDLSHPRQSRAPQGRRRPIRPRCPALRPKRLQRGGRVPRRICCGFQSVMGAPPRPSPKAAAVVSTST